MSMPARCPFHLVDSKGQRFQPETHPIRPGLPPVPKEMEHLPVDERGYPVPFFVAWVEGRPEFRASMRAAVQACVKHNVCWVCGFPLRGESVFTIGPMCSINRVSSEPPAHANCARYSALACPFLSRPHMDRRENDLPEGIQAGAGFSIRRNPGVTLLWFAREFQVENHPKGRLWRFTRRPIGVEWYCRGRAATRREVLDAIESGYPELERASKLDGSARMLENWRAKAMQLVPRR